MSIMNTHQGPGLVPGRYAGIREVTRVVDVVDEQRLAGLALTATASQLARMIAGFGSADGMRIAQQAKWNLSWHERVDGMIDFPGRAAEGEGCAAARRTRCGEGSVRTATSQTRPVR
jgi:hypothetical protein